MTKIESTPSVASSNAFAWKEDGLPISRVRTDGMTGQGLYLFIFAVSFLCLYFAGMEQFFPLVVLLLNFVWLLAGANSLFPLCSSFFISNELACFANIFIWLLLNKGKSRDGAHKTAFRFDKSTVAVAALLLASSFFQSTRLGTIANTIASACYLVFLVVLVHALRERYSIGDLCNAVRGFAITEVLISLLMMFKLGIEPGDGHCGTLGNAHFFGLVMCLSLILLIYYDWYAKHGIKLSNLVLYASILFVLYEADAKSALIAGLICTAILWLIRVLRKKVGLFRYDLAAFVLVLVSGMIVGSFVFQADAVELLLLSQACPFRDFFASYVYNDTLGINKFDYIFGTLTDMVENGHIFFGYGLGEYGSRFANLFGYTFTYRDPSALNVLVSQLFNSHMIPEYAFYASKYNESVVEVISWYSAVLTYPFSSVVALIGETGLVGVFLLVHWLKSIHLSPVAGTCFAFFFGACITDLYFDHIQVVGFLLLIVVTTAAFHPNRSSKWADNMGEPNAA